MAETTEILKEQYGAIPFRRRDDGSIEVMLVTSRRTGRWVIPKGWPATGMKPFEAAAREAMEEGGVVGQVMESPIGSYRHKKTLSDGSSVLCKVDVFALEVDAQMHAWPESHQRTTRWFPLADAAAAVREPELQSMLMNLSKLAVQLA